MNYGKSAYLKVVELEKKLNSFDTKSTSETNFLEFDKTKIGETLNGKTTISFPNIELYAGKEICFQIKICVSSNQTDTLKTSINLDKTSIHEEQFSVQSGSSEHIVIKTFCATVSKTQSLELVFENSSENNIVTIENIKLIIMGLSTVLGNDLIQMNALVFSDKALISFIDSGRLLYQICNLSPENINQDKFIFYSNALSHCFMNTENEQTKENIGLLIVDQDKTLKLAFPFSNKQELTIDQNVSFVCGTKLENHNDDNIIAYIKNGEIYYATINAGRVLKSRKLSFLKGTFKEISIATEDNSEYVYLIVTKEDNSSYILHSVIEADTGKFVDFVKAKYSFSVQKYIDMELADKKTIEHLKISHKFIANPYTVYDKFISEKAVSKLKIKMQMENTTYTGGDDDTILYGVKLDKSNPVGHSWATYTDDAVGFDKAYMDFDNDRFVSNGWEDRWPYSEIRPCLYDIKKASVIGYLKKNDFTKYENGRNANLTDKENSIVAIEFPKIYMKVSSDENYNYIQISNKALDGFYCRSHETAGGVSDHVYVSAYPGPGPEFETDGAYYFYSGMEYSFTTTKSFYKSDTPMRAFGNKFSCISYPFHILVCSLFAIMFKSTDCRKALGVGFTETPEHCYVGELNKKGMFYGKRTSGHTKLFGLEDYYGLAMTFCPGLLTRTLTKFSWNDPTKNSPLLSYRVDHVLSFSSHEITGVDFPFSPNYVVPISIYDNINFGFIGLTSEGNKNIELGFCDPVVFITSGLCSTFGNQTGGGGLFAMQTIKYNNFLPNTIIRPMHWEHFKE